MFVDGSSMLPSLQPGQLFVINRLAYPGWGISPRRGDVIVFRRRIPGNDAFLVKRVIGVPGDEVQVVDGTVFVNGARLDEPYVRAPDDYTYPIDGGPARVPEAAYFVLGDNRPISVDSHLGWFVAADDVIGEVEPLPIDLPVRAPTANA
jgi:signal peptidase I